MGVGGQEYKSIMRWKAGEKVEEVGWGGEQEYKSIMRWKADEKVEEVG